jgi:hypothetical protein
MAAYEQAAQHTPSQRQLAAELGIPRSTLQHWLARKGGIDADPEVVAFFESPAGVAFLHRLVLAAHFVMTLLGPCGIRLVCLFLELTGLDQFVAASYGPQRQVSLAMEEGWTRFSLLRSGYVSDTKKRNRDRSLLRLRRSETAPGL